jgi:hypothetical protein
MTGASTRGFERVEAENGETIEGTGVNTYEAKIESLARFADMVCGLLAFESARYNPDKKRNRQPNVHACSLRYLPVVERRF